MLVVLAILICLLWSVDSQAQSATRGLHAERFETQLTLLPDGSLQVAETITFRFTDRTFREVERRVPIRRVDALVDVEALMDGRVLPEGRGAGEARIRIGRRELRVVWRFPRTTDTTHQFTLRYRAMGAMRLETTGAHMDWHVLPTRHRYAISQAEVLWQVPAGAVSIGGPALEAEGWAWSREGDRLWVARKADVAVNETAILTDTIEVRTLQMAPPQWQIDADRARQLAPAFLVGALVILVMGAGIVVMMRFRYHRPRVDTGGAVPAARGSLPPGLGTAIGLTRPAVGLPQLSATFCDLLARGVLVLQEGAEGQGKKGAGYVVAAPRAPATLGLRPHEQVIVDTLWLHMKEGLMPLNDARRRLVSALSKYKAAVREELRVAGYIDAERRWAAQGMTTAGVMAVLIGFVSLVGFALLLLRTFGEASLLVPGAVILLGIIFIIAGESFPTLAGSGAAAGAQWQARRSWLRAEAAAGRAAQHANDWLPVAIGAGLGTHYTKPGVAPPWLMEIKHPSTALTAIIIAAGHSGVGGGGVVGGGMAGGGGFSGAR